jgi:hypothetical protein
LYDINQNKINVVNIKPGTTIGSGAQGTCYELKANFNVNGLDHNKKYIAKEGVYYEDNALPKIN